jgi:SAM-dependent methyltransferase
MTDSIGLGAPYFWEAKYTEELTDIIGHVECFDWYVPFDMIFEMVESFLNPELNHRILIVGLGRSNIVEVLYRKGFRDITAVDISPTVISKMQKKYEHLTGVDFIAMDAREMITLADCSFTAVIDYSEIFRVLRMDGIFLSVSHAIPLARVPYLRRIRWAIDMASLVEGEKLTLFVLTKTADEAMINRKITGAEAATRPEASGIVDNTEQTANKVSMVRKAGGGGQLTVTASIDKMIEMVDESGATDGD